MLFNINNLLADSDMVSINTNYSIQWYSLISTLSNDSKLLCNTNNSKQVKALLVLLFNANDFIQHNSFAHS